MQLKPAGTACRDPSNACDLPEFCTGASPHCPANVYLHDGHPCQGVDGYCYNGICQTHEQQCVTLWGPGTWPPPTWGLRLRSPPSVSVSIPPRACYREPSFCWAEVMGFVVRPGPAWRRARKSGCCLEPAPRHSRMVWPETYEYLPCARGETGLNQPGPLPSDGLTGSRADRRQDIPAHNPDCAPSPS